ncbi:uncharacterized protein VTP21DRAFT_8950 [Calcarisporiella thermophila]|uniref:uncharacterized protein n=1 Tax=Calcarisporiella thermophila TaxID=911321 RepID=UPI003742FA85
MSKPHDYCFLVRHDKSTLFIEASRNSSIRDIKSKILRCLSLSRPSNNATITDASTDEKPIPNDADGIRLYKGTGGNGSFSGPPPTSFTILEDSQTVEQLGLQDEQILYMTFFDSSKTKWEEVQVVMPELINDFQEDMLEEEEASITRKDKGKGKA